MKYYKYIFFSIILCCFQLSYLYGQSLQELERLQREYKDVLERQSLQKPKDVVDAEKLAKSSALPDKLVYSRKDVESLLVTTEKLLKELEFLKDSSSKMQYIGYDIFTKRDSIPFWQNLPIPKDYILGPGDEVIISMWGEVDKYDLNIIDKDGQIYVENIGILNMGNKSIIEAQKYILSKYAKVYSTLIGLNPKSYIDLSLGELKSVNVHFVGYVNMPGVHMIHPFSNVITGLIQAGGVDNNGSLREIKIIRNNNEISKVDVYDYIFSGGSISDFRLMDQDIVFIPPRISTVAITGRIRKPGYFELKRNEDVARLLSLSGGKDAKSSKIIYLFSSENDKNKSYMLDEIEASDFILSDGDSLHVPTKIVSNDYVFIGGQVVKPGQYPYYDKMKINDLLRATMTLNDDDFLNTVDLSKIKISRKNKSGHMPEKIIVNSNINDIALFRGDHITVPKKKYYEKIKSVEITGEVKIPGIFPVNNHSTLKEVLEMAGGLSDFALKNGIEIFRDSLKIGWENDSFILRHGDSLNVMEKTGLVLVRGEVNNAGYISFKKGQSINKYIEKAGGFSSFADTRDVFIIKPNGVASPAAGIIKPKVSEGSTIIVNHRKVSGSSRGPTGWEAFSIIASQAGNIATTLLSLVIIANQSSNAQ